MTTGAVEHYVEAGRGRDDAAACESHLLGAERIFRDHPHAARAFDACTALVAAPGRTLHSPSSAGAAQAPSRAAGTVSIGLPHFRRETARSRVLGESI